MKKSLKYVGFGILVLILLFFFIAKFSMTESSFQCTGEITRENVSQRSKTVYIKLTEYRPWIGLWSNSSGSLDLEIPNEWVEYYGYIEEVGDQFQIYETYPSKSLKGNFSKLSKTLAINLESPFGFFDGACVETN